MTTSNIADDLGRLVDEGRVTVEAVANVLGTPAERLSRFLVEFRGVPPGLTARPLILTGDEIARLSLLVVKLDVGLGIDDDERVTGMLESIVHEFGLSPRQIAILIDAEPEDVERALGEPGDLTAEAKHRIGLRGLYLLQALAEARGE